MTKYIQTSVDRYYDINSHSIDNYNYYYNSDGLKVPAKLTIEYLDNAKALNDGYKIEYSLYSTDIGPFSDKHDVKSFLNNVKKFEVRFKLIHDLDRYVELASDCYEWILAQKYNYKSHGTITVELDTARVSCDSPNCNFLYR